MSDVSLTVEGRVGVITLTRPKALNALSHDMIRQIDAQLAAWEQDVGIAFVLIESASERAFCAGGDIKQICLDGMSKAKQNHAFFIDEYEMNKRLYAYDKPVVSLIDGIVMGGGFGLAGHGRYRVGSEKTKFAMPEVGIGFYPDVGSGYVLSRMEDGFGFYLGLTGGVVGQGDAFACGFLTHCVASADMRALRSALVALEAAGEVEAVLRRFGGEATLEEAWAQRALLKRCFGGNSIATILGALDEATSTAPAAATQEFASKTAAQIRSKSPTSLGVTLKHLRGSRNLDFVASMEQEMRISGHMLMNPDFYEGVRAVVVDKDHRPDWQEFSDSAAQERFTASFLAQEPDWKRLQEGVQSRVV
ncbi:enoyl-CoA hydratase/isomerase family protein [Polycladidibacter hongkongensis]|uniref:enoyl-CoA hydratase/isomerase family protein n=1 Tax=Polycladidibacter hongkongensis TaxID=1647556 RepID=UPI000836464D|nr:enoyl-CoA hydratase/isomerase family protein [Pseudovibrio hongkongensis]